MGDYNGNELHEFPFRTYIGSSLQDKKLTVLKIDYNIKQNPFFIRFFIDELVEVEPSKYLGKAYVKIFPSYSYLLGYFELEK